MPKPLTYATILCVIIPVVLMYLCFTDICAAEAPQSPEKSETKQEEKAARKAAKVAAKTRRREHKAVEQQRRQAATEKRRQEIAAETQRLEQLRQEIGNKRLPDFGLLLFGIVIGIIIGKFLPRRRKA